MSSGIIYELRCLIGSEWHPFYVGRTENQRQRIQGHRSSARTGNTLVYQFIRQQLTANNIPWDLFPVETYDGDYVDQEDEHIMSLLYEGVHLKNMKKGDANWMARRQAEATDMRHRGIKSYRKYKEQLTLERQEQLAAERHAKWLADEIEQREKTRMREVLDKLAIEVEEKRRIAAEKEQQRRQIQLKRDQELAEIRLQQRIQWERDNAELLAQQAREREQQRLKEIEEYRSHITKLDNDTNTVLSKIGLPTLRRSWGNDTDLGDLGDLFEVTK